jgi:hypothetical protein
MSDTWSIREQRRFNHASFQVQPKKPRKCVRRTFTDRQLEIAMQALNPKEK